MISNSFQNSLKFSKNETYNPFIGILNQNPIIITKTDAFNFNYTDSDKLRLAQLLAKRDLKNIREENIKKIPESNFSEPVIAKKSDIRCKKTIKKNIPRERVSSIKRVPGPQTPNKVTMKKNMPVRSISPPTKDNDHIWRPKKINEVPIVKENEMDKLRIKVDQYASKLDGLERHLMAKARDAHHNIIPSNFMNSQKPPKSNFELNILSDKLQQLMKTKRGSQINIDNITRSSNQPQHGKNFDLVLSKLDNLLTDMNSIQSRWKQVDYENVSLYSDDPVADDEIRFTNGDIPPWQDIVMGDKIDDGKILLDFPKQTVVRLDQTRQVNQEAYRLLGVPVKMLHIDWLSGDLVDELVDEIVDEINDANNQLVDAILNSELED